MNDPPRAWNIFHRDYRKNTEKLEIIRSISSRPEDKNIARAKENDGRWRLTRSKTMLSHPRSINVTPLVRERGIVADYYKPFFHPVLTDPPPHPPPSHPLLPLPPPFSPLQHQRVSGSGAAEIITQITGKLTAKCAVLLPGMERGLW